MILSRISSMSFLFEIADGVSRFVSGVYNVYYIYLILYVYIHDQSMFIGSYLTPSVFY